MNFNIIMYVVFGLLAIAGGVALFIARHPIRGAMGLLGAMLSLAGMYAILNAHAIAVFQVIIYAGAIMVLVTYIIMLLDLRTEDFLHPFSRFITIGLPLVIIAAVLLLVKVFGIRISEIVPNVNSMTMSAHFGTVKSIGKELITKYLFSFEYVSTLLFAAIVAVIAIVQLDWKGHKKYES